MKAHGTLSHSLLFGLALIAGSLLFTGCNTMFHAPQAAGDDWDVASNETDRSTYDVEQPLIPASYAMMQNHPNSPQRNPWRHLPFMETEDHPAWWTINPRPETAPRAFVVRPENAYYVANPVGQQTSPDEAVERYRAYCALQTTGRIPRTADSNATATASRYPSTDMR